MKTENISLTFNTQAFPGEWSMAVSLTGYPKGPGQYPKLKAKAGEADVYKFKIKTDNINFAKDNPIEISLAPGQTGPGNPGQFTWAGAGTDTLTVNNPNSDGAETEYYYKLNFDNAKPLDPIIQNGCCRLVSDGGSGGFLSFFSEPTGIALLLLSVAAIALVALRMRRAG